MKIALNTYEIVRKRKKEKKKEKLVWMGGLSLLLDTYLPTYIHHTQFNESAERTMKFMSNFVRMPLFFCLATVGSCL